MPAHPPSASPVFHTTRWSVILAAQHEESPDALAAMEILCRMYWYPLYAYVRRSGHGPHDAQDLTQDFFARLIAKEWISSVAPEHGRFRNFLLVAMKRYLAKEWHRERTLKRGGAFAFVPLDGTEAEQRYASEPGVGADVLYERRWALTLLDATLDRLNQEFSGHERSGQFDQLKEWLTAGRGEIPYDELAQKLGMSEGAARVAVHRMRKRFRELFREAIAETVSEPGEVEGEMRHLAATLGNSA
ncbi:MAG TPA: sigma-70 family RNA polymerase sigma factor [Chthoniobacteraceae bacterium]|nr:sigma-70 family RNA polymerase sigma factor [Chthoniobacteraceae bacterium]